MVSEAMRYALCGMLLKHRCGTNILRAEVALTSRVVSLLAEHSEPKVGDPRTSRGGDHVFQSNAF